MYLAEMPVADCLS